MKYCVDCKHYLSSSSRCKNEKLGRSPVTGNIESMGASHCRSETAAAIGMCGPKGRWFEPKPKRQIGGIFR